jgi:hypothetical protein
MSLDDENENENEHDDDTEEDSDDSMRSFSVFVQDSDQNPVCNIAVHCDYGLDGSDLEYTDDSGHVYFEAKWNVSFRIFVRGMEMNDGDYHEIEYDGEEFTVEYDP